MTKRGFTLVELLIVIAILAVLAGILFTVFAPAKEKARQTHCMNNLKQLGAAILLYKTDYDGGWPRALRETYPQYVSSDEVFVCPDDGATSDMRESFRAVIRPLPAHTAGAAVIPGPLCPATACGAPWPVQYATADHIAAEMIAAITPRASRC